jgi:hypothetical protein
MSRDKRSLSLCLTLLAFAGSLGCAFAQSNADTPWKQTEGSWVDDRWNQTDIGSFHCANLPLPNGTVKKGLAIRVGEKGEAAIGFDMATCDWRAGWAGGFLKFGAARYGLANAPKAAGEIRFLAPDGAWKGGEVHWRGLHVNGSRVVLEYTVGGASVLETPWFAGDTFTRTFAVASSDKELRVALALKASGATGSVEGFSLALENGRADLVIAPGSKMRSATVSISAAGDVKLSEAATADLPATLAVPGPPRWKPLTTRGTLGTSSEAYVVDTLTVPYANPWNALFFLSGVDFLSNGDAAVCTIHGDVWLVSGIDDKLAEIKWQRFATGLFQPLGLRVIGGKILVLGRDQITRLHDLNGDGEADFYENFCNLIKTSSGGHDFVSSLCADAAGQLYYVDPIGVHRVAADGSKIETLATGWRNPNGLGVSDDGKIITVTPQEGNWTPASSICEVKAGGYYGYGGPRVDSSRPLGYDPPLCWIPHAMDNSSASQVWTPKSWGPLGGQMLHLSFGLCRSYLVLREQVGDVMQGGVVPLKARFLSGAMRGSFRPQDGQLYVAGTRGWQTSGVRDGCLQRLRYTGKKLPIPVGLHACANGLLVEFNEPLDRAAAEDPGSYGVQRWQYKYAATYGSKDYSIASPGKEGRDEVEVKSARLQADGRSVFLEIPTIAPVMQMALQYSLNTADRTSFAGEINHTIHALGPPR